MNISYMTIEDGERIPRFYGIAWRDHSRCVYVCYPLPFNWIAWALREVLFRLKQTPKTRYDKAYSLGRQAATTHMHKRIEEARQDGYTEGANAVVRELEKRLP